MNRKIIILLFTLLQVASAKAEFITNVHAISRRDGLSNGAVNSIVKDAEGYVWMGTWNGLNRYDGSNIVTYLPGSNSSSIHNHVIREMYPVKSGPIWMLTNKGVGLYDNVNDRFFSFFTDESDQINYENDIAICHSDTVGNGAYNLKLTEFPNRRLPSEKLSYPIVRSILVTRNNDILVGTKGGGIDVFDADGRYKRQISVQNGLSNNSVISLHEHKDGSIWVGIDGKGIDIISSDFNTIRNFPDDFIISNTFDFASVYRILKSSDGRIYLGTSGYGVILVELDKQTGSIKLSFHHIFPHWRLTAY